MNTILAFMAVVGAIGAFASGIHYKICRGKLKSLYLKQASGWSANYELKYWRDNAAGALISLVFCIAVLVAVTCYFFDI